MKVWRNKIIVSSDTSIWMKRKIWRVKGCTYVRTYVVIFTTDYRWYTFKSGTGTGTLIMPYGMILNYPTSNVPYTFFDFLAWRISSRKSTYTVLWVILFLIVSQTLTTWVPYGILPKKSKLSCSFQEEYFFMIIFFSIISPLKKKCVRYFHHIK